MATRALDLLLARYTVAEAYALARRAIATLTIDDFSETVRQTYDVADVYGICLDRMNWYLKLTIDETAPAVIVISFHAAERPLRTNRGLLQPSGRKR